MFYKHKNAYEVMLDALSSFGKGDRKAKLKHLIKTFEEYETFDDEINL